MAQTPVTKAQTSMKPASLSGTKRQLFGVNMPGDEELENSTEEWDKLDRSIMLLWKLLEDWDDQLVEVLTNERRELLPVTQDVAPAAPTGEPVSKMPKK